MAKYRVHATEGSPSQPKLISHEAYQAFGDKAQRQGILEAFAQLCYLVWPERAGRMRAQALSTQPWNAPQEVAAARSSSWQNSQVRF
eukprot:3945565-Prorocentrum_lima.AAC.1